MTSMTKTTFHLKQLAKVVLNHRGQRHVVLRQELFDLLSRFSPAVAVDHAGIRYYVSTGDAGLSRIVFGEGSYEQDIMEHALSLAERHCGRAPLLQGRTFVDVGANIGTSTLPALLTFGAADAIAFEPDDENYRLLRCNLVANEVENRARTLRLALSDHAGHGELERAESSWGDHRVRVLAGSPDGSYGESSRPTARVELVRFDDAVRDLPIDLGRVGIVWMDTQGHEGHILAGARSLLESDVPVLIEYWPYGLRRLTVLRCSMTLSGGITGGSSTFGRRWSPERRSTCPHPTFASYQRATAERRTQTSSS